MRADQNGWSFRKKAGYVWDYYKIHLISAVVLVALIIVTVDETKSKKESVLNITIAAETVNREQMEHFQKEWTDQVIPSAEQDRREVFVQMMEYGSENTAPQQQIAIQKMGADLSAGFIDIFLVDESMFEQLNQQEQLIPLSTISRDEKTASMYIDVTEKTDLFLGERVMLCIPANAENRQAAATFIQYMEE